MARWRLSRHAPKSWKLRELLANLSEKMWLLTYYLDIFGQEANNEIVLSLFRNSDRMKIIIFENLLVLTCIISGFFLSCRTLDCGTGSGRDSAENTRMRTVTPGIITVTETGNRKYEEHQKQ